MKSIIRILGALIGIYLILVNYGALAALSISIHVGARLADAGESVGPFWRELGYFGGTGVALIISMVMVVGIGGFIGYSTTWALTKIPALLRHDAS